MSSVKPIRPDRPHIGSVDRPTPMQRSTTADVAARAEQRGYQQGLVEGRTVRDVWTARALVLGLALGFGVGVAAALEIAGRLAGG